MDRLAPFLVRRVFVGVVIGCAILVLVFLGWARYRTGQWDDRERALEAGYHRAYTQCVGAGGQPALCAKQVRAACNRDAFWSSSRPFAFLPGSVVDDHLSRCLTTASATG